ncbi:MAG: lamin tail domain-containing protein, partial [Flavobacteriales bacterium]|nr:lamin tail domain-containing protein [Flavobacteriales bacterium]
IPYVGSQAGVTIFNFSGSGTVGGDDPAVVPNGTIVISGIDESLSYDLEFSAPCDLITLSGPAPICEPPPDYTVLVINEVDYDNAGSDTDEFVEILNTGAVDIDLTGLSLQLWNGSNTTVYNTIALDPVVLAAGDYFVVGSATVPNVDQV